MGELNPVFFEVLRLAKQIYDAPRFKGLWSAFQNTPLDEDSVYELEMETATSMFQDTGIYYNEDEDKETWVMKDPVIDRFCYLCERLETEKGLDDEIDPYRRQAEQVIHDGFCLNSYAYDYGWRLSPRDRGCHCVFFIIYPEFYGLDELPGAMMDIWDGFQELNRRLEAELGLNKLAPIYPFPPQKGAKPDDLIQICPDTTERKEAA